jgi:hypothetical protein
VAMRVFAWGDSEEALATKSWGESDFKNSEFDQSLVLGRRKLIGNQGKAIVNFRRWTVARLAQWRCPPTSSPSMVDWAVQAVIRKFCDEDEVVFYPLEAICKDGISKEFSFIAPRLRLPCIDLEKSDLTMGTPDSGPPYVFQWARLSFLDNCLGDAHIAWEKHLPGCIAVSEPLRDALMSLGGKGLAIVRPEDYKC